MLDALVAFSLWLPFLHYVGYDYTFSMSICELCKIKH